MPLGRVSIDTRKNTKTFYDIENLSPFAFDCRAASTMHAPHNATVVHMLRLLVLLSSVSDFFNGIPLCTNGIPALEEIPFAAGSDGVLPQSTIFRRSQNKEVTTELDLGSCGHRSKVPCIESGTCESIPLLEPSRCRRRYCPLNKVYCLDFDGCMIPDPIFIFSLSPIEKKCPIPLSLCANKDLCQYVLRKNYDDLREPSVDRLNCSIMTNRIVFTNSSCNTHSDCHWTAKCCPDGGLNRQCISYEGKVLPARMSNDVDSTTTETSLSSVPFNPDEPSDPADPWSTSLQNRTKSTKIRIMNSFNTVVEGRLLEFQSSIRVQLAKSLNISENVFTRIIARNGSILLKVEMSPISPNMTVEVEQAHAKLASMLKQGSLVLTDLNSTKLDVPPQQNGQVLTDETGGYSNIFIGVTAASLSSTFLLIFWVVWNLKKNKTINPMGGHSERLSSHSLFMTKQSTDNLGLESSPGLRRNSNNKFTTFAESQAQWEIFQQHFPAKPDYVWKSQSDEAVWAGIDHQVHWPQLLDAPDEESVPITSKANKK